MKKRLTFFIFVVSIALFVYKIYLSVENIFLRFTEIYFCVFKF